MARRAGIGYAMETVRIAPVLRSVAAGVVGMALTAALMVGLLYLRLRSQGDYVFGIGLEDGGAVWTPVWVGGLLGR